MIKVLASGSKGNSYILQAGEEILLLECGLRYDYIKKGINFRLDKVVGCLVTHNHKDHSMTAEKLAFDGIKIYGPSEVIESLYSKDVNKHRTRIIGDRDNFRIGNFRIKSFKNYHNNSDGSPCECLGYLINHKDIGTILFATDTYLIKPIFKDVDHILVECNYNEIEEEEREEHDTRRLESHMSLKNLKTFLARWNLERTKTITLIHLSQDRADSEVMRTEIEELTGKKVLIAEKGLVIYG